MASLEEAKRLFNEAVAEVNVQRMYEGYSTRSGNKIYQDAYDAATYYIRVLEVEREKTTWEHDIPREILKCPVHNMTDCSPLLNGCSIPNHLAKAYLAGRER